MFVRKKRIESMQKTARKQSDDIYVLSMQNEKLKNDLLLAENDIAKLRSDIAELDRAKAAAESRSEAMRKAAEGMIEVMRRAVYEAGSLRGENGAMQKLINGLSSASYPVRIASAYPVAEDV